MAPVSPECESRRQKTYFSPFGPHYAQSGQWGEGYGEVFSPSRSILRPQLAVNGFEAVASLLTPTTRRCPHLGCALKWNPVEHTWDCPCHGSRFTEDGKRLDGPATGDLKG